jgi:LAO/AO transport system kinase
MPDPLDHWVQQILAGETRAVSRAISVVENQESVADQLLRAVFFRTGRAMVIGVTGAPGTGKSTLVDRMAAHFRRHGQRVGIIAVDPTSPFTGGAILGDRIRMQGHSHDEGIFIRSMATRGFLGGLARATADIALLLDAAGKEIILVETVGVGQDEVDIVRLAHCTLLVMVPGLGDDVQNMKAGLMEIGDIFVLNKSDREGADRFEQQLQAMLQIEPERHGWRPEIVRTVANEGKGIEQLLAAIERFRNHAQTTPEWRRRETDHWHRRLVEMLESRLLEQLLASPGSEARLEALAQQVAQRKTDPYSAVSGLLEGAGVRASG